MQRELPQLLCAGFVQPQKKTPFTWYAIALRFHGMKLLIALEFLSLLRSLLRNGLALLYPQLTCGWTSVVASKYFWKARAAFAVIDQNTCVVASGKVRHWALSSYTAELYAILVAFASSSGPCVIHTDSLTIVQQFQRLLLLDQLPCNLQHFAWWKFPFHFIDERGGKESCPLHIVWCPAHNWDHLPLESITDEMLDFKSLSREDLVNHRKADLVAKEHLDGYSAITLRQIDLDLCNVQRHHLWLAQLHKYISEDTSNRIPTSSSSAAEPQEAPPTNHKELYPRWAWDANPADFTALSPAVDGDFSGFKGKIKPGNWVSATRWLAGLRWQVLMAMLHPFWSSPLSPSMMGFTLHPTRTSLSPSRK